MNLGGSDSNHLVNIGKSQGAIDTVDYHGMGGDIQMQTQIKDIDLIAQGTEILLNEAGID